MTWRRLNTDKMVAQIEGMESLVASMFAVQMREFGKEINRIRKFHNV